MIKVKKNSKTTKSKSKPKALAVVAAKTKRVRKSAAVVVSGDPVVGIVMGSGIGLGFFCQAAAAVEKFGIPY